MSITVVGSVALDSIETPFGKTENELGGAATHFSVCSSFFTGVKIIGVVGSDFPKKHIEFFESRQIDTTGLQIIPDGKTFHWAGQYEDKDINSAITLDTQLNVFKDFQPTVPATHQNSNILFLANIHPDLQHHVMDLAGKPGLIALDTMNLWINTTRASLENAIRRVNIVIINEGEVKLLTGCKNVIAGARDVQAMGPKIVVVKRGEYGALLFHHQQVFSTPAYPVELVKDPTGAGDTFAGGMMGYLDRCPSVTFETLKTAMIYGSVMASFNVEDFGCQRLRRLTREEINQRLGEFVSLTQFSPVLL